MHACVHVRIVGKEIHANAACMMPRLEVNFKDFIIYR